LTTEEKQAKKEAHLRRLAEKLASQSSKPPSVRSSTDVSRSANAKVRTAPPQSTFHEAQHIPARSRDVRENVERSERPERSKPRIDFAHVKKTMAAVEIARRERQQRHKELMEKKAKEREEKLKMEQNQPTNDLSDQVCQSERERCRVFDRICQ
jgi:hypothetical protein